MQKLKVLELFAGIAGFSVGLERTGGFETVAVCELDEFCRKVLRKNLPDAIQYEDVRTLTADRLRADGIAVDVITGGFPCQDVSAAAYAHGRSGINGKRSGLFAEVIRLAEELAPKVIILENVAGLLTDGLVTVLQGLGEVGYDAEWHTIPAAALGSAQARDRIWIIAYPSEERNAGPFKGLNFSAPRQGWQGRQTYLQDVAASPFSGTDSVPQSILCGVDVRVPNWVDRVGACGNSAHPAVIEMIGNAILQSMEEPHD